MSVIDNFRSKPRLWASAGLVTVGLAGGAILGSTLTAGASTSTTAPSSGTGGSSSPSSNSGTAGPCHGAAALSNSGTVTAVGTNSVTIDGKVYAVTSNSDIDKNGEASLSALAVGDKVTFSTVSGASTPTIDRLHAGNEALDRPSGPRPDGAGPQGGPSGRMAPSGGTSA